CLFFFSSRRRHTRFSRDWSSDVCSSDLAFWRGSYWVGTTAGSVLSIDADNPANTQYHQFPDIDQIVNFMIVQEDALLLDIYEQEIGRASCRERVMIVVEPMARKQQERRA